MAKNDEISSTEKLLDVIRSKSAGASSDHPKPALQPPDLKPAGLGGNILFKKKVTVGIDIGVADIKLVAVSLSGDRKPELVDYARLPFESGLRKDKNRFSQFLKTGISNFCSSSKKAEFWCIISSARVETRYIRIPKVPARQVANAVYWTYKKEVNFNDQSDIFDFEMIGDVVEEGARKLAVIAYSAPRQEIQELKSMFARIGYPLTGISIIPFAMQNFLRNQWVDIGDRNICNLFIGTDWSRIAIFSEGNLILSREIKSGIQSMVEAIGENIDPAPDEGPAASAEREDASSAPGAHERQMPGGMEKARKLFHRFIHEATGAAGGGPIAGEDEDIFGYIATALERIVRQVERTLEHYALNFKTEPISKVFVSGETSSSRRILDYIGKQLEMPIEAIDPFALGLAHATGPASPATDSERGGFVPVIGIALSSNGHTPNFIHTYKDKEKIATTARLNRAILGGVLLFILIFAGTFYWQDHTISVKRFQEKQFQQKLDRYIPYVDENLIQQMLAQVEVNKQSLTLYQTKYSAKALLAIVSGSTPPNIRLVSLTADFGAVSEEKAGKTDINQNPKKRLILEGVIFGDRLTFESALAGYLVQLKKSPVFGHASVKKRAVEFHEEKEVMKFTAQLELI